MVTCTLSGRRLGMSKNRVLNSPVLHFPCRAGPDSISTKVLCHGGSNKSGTGIRKSQSKAAALSASDENMEAPSSAVARYLSTIKPYVRVN